jgi:tRNA threonylcarbamoyladenosine biosynthesis protein TsaB
VKHVLCIDTASTDRFALALAEDGALTASLEQPCYQDHSRALLEAIDGMLPDRSTRGGIVVVRGPGSYAGLRVGIATAEGLAFALKVPVAGVPTLDAVAVAAQHLDPVRALHPAGRGEWAGQVWSSGSAAGEMVSVPVDSVPTDAPFAGEGAGAAGGYEVPAATRCEAALTLGLARGFDSSGRVEALYLREPHITRPKRQQAEAGSETKGND